MTKQIKVTMGREVPSITIPNFIIDNFMSEAEGSYIKVYLYLLRSIPDPDMPVSVDEMSEKLDVTIKNVNKALKYWASKKLISVTKSIDDTITDISIIPYVPVVPVAEPVTRSLSASYDRGEVQPSANENSDISASYEEGCEAKAASPVRARRSSAKRIPAISGDESSAAPRPDYSPSQLCSMRDSYPEYDSLLDNIESLLGRTLTHKDMETPAFLFESLGFSTDLIRYLYEYSFSVKPDLNAKTTAYTKYIEKIATAWHEKGITTVEDAKEDVLVHSEECNVVRRELGISGQLTSAQLKCISKWSSEYNMSSELIGEACRKTIFQIGKSNFNYVETILSKWYNAGVTSMEDVIVLDKQHGDSAASKPSRPASSRSAAPVNKFAQFPQRQYTAADYEEMERKMMNR